MEEWKNLEQASNYAVSTLGRIKNVLTGRVLKPGINSAGYVTCVLVVAPGITKTFSVHRLVALAFLTRNSDSQVVNHKNGNKTDNQVFNLEWVSNSENVKHAIQTGLRKQLGGRTKHRVRIIETGEVFDSLVACAEFLGCHYTGISACLKGEYKSYVGYTFERVD